MMNFKDIIENLEVEIYNKNKLKDDLLQQLDDVSRRQVEIEDEIVSLDREIENLIKELEDTKVADKFIDDNNIYEQLKEIGTLKETINALIERYAEFVETKEEYEIGKSYTYGDTFKYQGIVYAVVQPHTSQADWKPDLRTSLYKVLRQTEEAGDDAVIQEWVQPTGAHDAYDIGDKVLYNGKVYQSKVSANITVPDGDEPYNRYWEVITNG